MMQSESIQDTKFSKLKNNSSNSILKRISSTDKTAVTECLNCYGSMIWFLAKEKFVGTNLENVVREIFTDIWKFADKFNPKKHDEATFIKLIAIRRLEIAKRSY